MQMPIKLRKIKKSDLGYFLKWWKDRDLINLTSGFYEKSNEVLANYFLDIFARSNKFLNIIATAMGPMPPGTGVKTDATAAQAGSASPAIRRLADAPASLAVWDADCRHAEAVLVLLPAPCAG